MLTLAATTDPVAPFLVEVGILVAALAAVARLAGALRIPAVPLYLLVGVAAGSGGLLPLAFSADFIAAGAQIGVLLLLFMLGLEFSGDDLAESLRSGRAASAVDALNALPGLIVALALGWSLPAAFLLADATYASSSGIVAKLLDELDRVGNRETPSSSASSCPKTSRWRRSCRSPQSSSQGSPSCKPPLSPPARWPWQRLRCWWRCSTAIASADCSCTALMKPCCCRYWAWSSWSVARPRRRTSRPRSAPSWSARHCQIQSPTGRGSSCAQAILGLGYRYLSSSWYAEQPRFLYTDADGLIHIPWSQIACGNGAASWTNCQTTSPAAHSGVDCDDETLCRPDREPRAKTYDPWSDYAANSLADRCRHDITERYGVCSILFELTSYDADFSTGAPDERALAGYERTLEELKDLADEQNAVFMTLGQFAAAKLIEDTKAPEISIAAPTAGRYGHHEKVTVDVEATDDLSGVHSIEAKLDGVAIADGDEIDMLDLALGEHTVSVRAEDTAGNVDEQRVTFEVVATFGSLLATIDRLQAEGGIDSDGIARSLESKVDAARSAADRGQTETARRTLEAFIVEVEAQRGEHITKEAADLLTTDARYVVDRL